MNVNKMGWGVMLSAAVTLGGIATTPASAHTLAKSYSCTIHPKQKKCTTGTGGTRVTGGTGGTTTGATGGSRSGGAGSGSGANSAGGRGTAGANGKGANVNGANANGSSPRPAKGLPVTGFGGTATDFAASPRVAAAGTQPVVVGVTSANSAQRVTALPATGGGGVPAQPMSPLPALIAAALAVIGLGLRKAARFL